MKNCLLILIAGAVLCVPLGCNRDESEEPAAYERDVDGPPVAIRTSIPDYEIIGDPSAVARRRQVFKGGVADAGSGSSGGGGLTGPETEASQEEIAQVKDVIAKVMATEDGDKTAALAFFDDEASTSLKGIMQAHADLQAKALALDSLMETKFGLQYPATVRAKIKKIPGETKSPSSPAELIDGASMDQLSFTKIGDKIVVTTPKKRKLVFSSTNAGWKIGFDKDSRELVGLFTEMLSASTKMLDAATAGVEDGSITADNVEMKMAELAEQIVAPVGQKLMMLMMKAMGEAMGAGGGTVTVPGGDTTVPDTTAPDTTVPDTTVPDPAATDTNVPDTTVPDTTVPDTTVPDTTVPTEDSTPPSAGASTPGAGEGI